MKKFSALAMLLLMIVVIIMAGGTILSKKVRASFAERAGTAFIERLYAEYTILGQNCQGEDTDGDAYVSCDMRIKNPSHEERVVHLQCPTIVKSIFGSTCKESRIVITP
jgi:hypothetical protein